jgi:hypothetical protein
VRKPSLLSSLKFSSYSIILRTHNDKLRQLKTLPRFQHIHHHHSTSTHWWNGLEINLFYSEENVKNWSVAWLFLIDKIFSQKEQQNYIENLLLRTFNICFNLFGRLAGRRNRQL